VEVWPHGLLFWRSLTQWLGGMGIISLFIAVIANLGTRAKQLFRSELPGVATDNLSPRIRETARRLWITYVVLSACCTIVFYLLGMDLFDSLCHAFGTISTSGFSTKNASIAFYASPQIEWAIIFFMFISGTSFALHFFSFRTISLRVYWKNAEFKFYTGIILVISLLVFLNLGGPWQGAGWGDSFRIAFFHVTSIVTTTGFAAVDNNLWSHMGTALILMMMFIGGCSGSTAGGIKPGRYLIILKRSFIEFKKMIHPRAVYSLRFGERFIKEDLLLNVLQFFFLYIVILSVSMLYLTTQGLDILSSLTAAAGCLGTTGSGMGIVGPVQNFSSISGSGKYVLCALMLIGRLEIYPVLVLLIPAFWQE
jgi:trk system potassium uptake protein TrkH